MDLKKLIEDLKSEQFDCQQLFDELYFELMVNGDFLRELASMNLEFLANEDVADKEKFSQNLSELLTKSCELNDKTLEKALEHLQNFIAQLPAKKRKRSDQEDNNNNNNNKNNKSTSQNNSNENVLSPAAIKFLQPFTFTGFNLTNLSQEFIQFFNQFMMTDVAASSMAKFATEKHWAKVKNILSWEKTTRGSEPYVPETLIIELIKSSLKKKLPVMSYDLLAPNLDKYLTNNINISLEKIESILACGRTDIIGLIVHLLQAYINHSQNKAAAIEKILHCNVANVIGKLLELKIGDVDALTWYVQDPRGNKQDRLQNIIHSNNASKKIVAFVCLHLENLEVKIKSKQWKATLTTKKWINKVKIDDMGILRKISSQPGGVPDGLTIDNAANREDPFEVSVEPLELIPARLVENVEEIVKVFLEKLNAGEFEELLGHVPKLNRKDIFDKMADHAVAFSFFADASNLKKAESFTVTKTRIITNLNELVKHLNVFKRVDLAEALSKFKNNFESLCLVYARGFADGVAIKNKTIPDSQPAVILPAEDKNEKVYFENASFTPPQDFKEQDFLDSFVASPVADNTHSFSQSGMLDFPMPPPEPYLMKFWKLLMTEASNTECTPVLLQELLTVYENKAIQNRLQLAALSITLMHNYKQMDRANLKVAEAKLFGAVAKLIKNIVRSPDILQSNQSFANSIQFFGLFIYQNAIKVHLNRLNTSQNIASSNPQVAQTAHPIANVSLPSSLTNRNSAGQPWFFRTAPSNNQNNNNNPFIAMPQQPTPDGAGRPVPPRNIR